MALVGTGRPRGGVVRPGVREPARRPCRRSSDDGAWPGIVLASLLWAVWHVGIQGTGFLAADLASVVVGQGVQGLFLGYLWSRYRLMWPILTVHGAINAATIVIALL